MCGPMAPVFHGDSGDSAADPGDIPGPQNGAGRGISGGGVWPVCGKVSCGLRHICGADIHDGAAGAGESFPVF